VEHCLVRPIGAEPDREIPAGRRQPVGFFIFRARCCLERVLAQRLRARCDRSRRCRDEPRPTVRSDGDIGRSRFLTGGPLWFLWGSEGTGRRLRQFRKYRWEVGMSELTAVEIKAFVPARDFALSKQFYQDLGFTIAWSDADLAYVR